MKVVLYNTSKQQDRILRDWIAYPTKAGYFAERKESVLLHASRDQLPQFLFLYSYEMEMISFYFLFGTDNYHRGIVPFIALTDFDELDLKAAQFFAPEIEKLCLKYQEIQLAKDVPYLLETVEELNRMMKR